MAIILIIQITGFKIFNKIKTGVEKFKKDIIDEIRRSKDRVIEELGPKYQEEELAKNN